MFLFLFGCNLFRSGDIPSTCEDMIGGCNGLSISIVPPEMDCTLQTWHEDADGDGYGTPFAPVDACNQPSGHVSDFSDCDDSNPEINPGATEVCDDALDNDCNNQVDDALDALIWYFDVDGDGYGDELDSIYACDPPSSYVDNPNDCNDVDPLVNPAALEEPIEMPSPIESIIIISHDLCLDKLDNDCNGYIDADDKKCL